MQGLRDAAGPCVVCVIWYHTGVEQRKDRRVSHKARRGKKKVEKPTLTFEQALARLEEIAGKLESGELRLEEMIALAEEGLRLSQVCEKQLTEAEGRIEQLMERMGGAELEPLEIAPDAGEEEE